MPVFLIGYMGSGKSTIGYELSKMIKCSFFDLDVLIEEEMGMSVSDVFDQKGQFFFREKEHDVLTNYNFSSRSIMDSGGATSDSLTNILKISSFIFSSSC